MQITDLQGNGQVRAGRTEIDVPHRGEISTFILPMQGPNYHNDVMKSIDSQKLIRPTTAQTLSLVDIAQQNPDEPHCAAILDKFRKNYLRTATENVSFPDGALVYDNVDGKMPSNRSALLELAQAGDSRVRFVESGFKTGWMSLDDALTNPYVIAQLGGVDMLPVFERIAKRINDKDAYVFGLSGTEQDTKRYTAVLGYYDRLNLDGDCDGNGRLGFASGVLILA
jgi:hypothetical protein